MKIGCLSEMSKPSDASKKSKKGIFVHDLNYVITPTYKTKKELDKHVKELREKSVERGYSDRIPQRVFLQILGVREPVGSREYKNVVFLNTGEYNSVKDAHGKILWWYMKFHVEKNALGFRDTVDMHVHNNLNTYVG